MIWRSFSDEKDEKELQTTDTSNIPAQTDLSNLKAEVDKIHIDKVKTVPDYLRKVSNVVDNDLVSYESKCYW